jgi:hypothetical protein
MNQNVILVILSNSQPTLLLQHGLIKWSFNWHYSKMLFLQYITLCTDVSNSMPTWSHNWEHPQQTQHQYQQYAGSRFCLLSEDPPLHPNALQTCSRIHKCHLTVQVANPATKHKNTCYNKATSDDEFIKNLICTLLGHKFIYFQLYNIYIQLQLILKQPTELSLLGDHWVT